MIVLDLGKCVESFSTPKLEATPPAERSGGKTFREGRTEREVGATGKGGRSLIASGTNPTYFFDQYRFD
jgi:hypothetical protein